MTNSWIEHVRNYAKLNNLSYMCAQSTPDCKASYKKPIKIKKNKIIDEESLIPLIPIKNKKMYRAKLIKLKEEVKPVKEEVKPVKKEVKPVKEEEIKIKNTGFGLDINDYTRNTKFIKKMLSNIKKKNPIDINILIENDKKYSEAIKNLKEKYLDIPRENILKVISNLNLKENKIPNFDSDIYKYNNSLLEFLISNTKYNNIEKLKILDNSLKNTLKN